MACLGLKNQLLPSKKVWNSFTSKFQSKLSKLKRAKALKHAKARLNTILQSPSSSSYHRRRKKRRTRRLHQHRHFAPVFVDELYNQPTPVHVECVEPYLEKSATRDQLRVTFGAAAVPASSSSSSSSCGPSSSLVRGMGEVDLRAEMFIRKFREEMRLQRQRSFGEYQEMLARGV